MLSYSLFTSLTCATLAAAALTNSSLTNYVDSLSLDFQFGPVKASYWTGYPHHRRTPFSLSPDSRSAYLAYLDNSGTDVHVQQVDPATFAAVGKATTVTGGKEAGGLVAMNDGFALLTNEVIPSTTANAPPGNTPAPVLYRYTNGAQSWKTFLGGPNVHPADGLAMSPDLNGDLVYSETAGLFGAYFVVTEYQGWAEGHFGDSVEYVNDQGQLQNIKGASSSWGCSHNTGIAFEAADQPPYAGVCAEDHGALWLNTDTQGMDGVKISNENTTNGDTNEAMGGMSGSYSSLARFINQGSYIFTWVSRGATNLAPDSWRGNGYTTATNRTNNRNVAIALMSDKSTLVGPQAISTVGAADGDSQINWLTNGSADCSNAHVAAFDGSNALVTWEEIEDPQCYFIAMGCKGKFTGSRFQQVDASGAKSGDPLVSTDTYVAGDMVTMPDGRICWPYPHVTWTLDQASNSWGGSSDLPGPVSKMSFACMSLGGANGTAPAPSGSSSAAGASSTTAAAASSSSVSAADVSSAGSSATTAPSVPTAAGSSASTGSSVAAAGGSSVTGTSTLTVEPIGPSSTLSSPSAFGLPPASPTAGSQSTQAANPPDAYSSVTAVAPSSASSLSDTASAPAAGSQTTQTANPPEASTSVPVVAPSSGSSLPDTASAPAGSVGSTCTATSTVTVTVTATTTLSSEPSEPTVPGAGSSVSQAPTIPGPITPGGPMVPAPAPTAAEAATTSACTRKEKRHVSFHERRAAYAH